MTTVRPGWTDLLRGNDLTQHWTIDGNWNVKVADDGVVALQPQPGEN